MVKPRFHKGAHLVIVFECTGVETRLDLRRFACLQTVAAIDRPGNLATVDRAERDRVAQAVSLDVGDQVSARFNSARVALYRRPSIFQNTELSYQSFGRDYQVARTR